MQSFSTPGATDSMIDFGGEEAAVMGRQGHESLYQGGALDEAQAGEPEERKVHPPSCIDAEHVRHDSCCKFTLADAACSQSRPTKRL